VLLGQPLPVFRNSTFITKIRGAVRVRHYPDVLNSSPLPFITQEGRYENE